MLELIEQETVLRKREIPVCVYLYIEHFMLNRSFVENRNRSDFEDLQM